jgi:hypothetical protein
LLILRMVEQGKISAEEAARLLNALGGDEPSKRSGGGKTSSQRDPFDTAHGLRIRVQDMRTGHEQVNINVPTGLVRFGLRFVPNSAGVDVQSIEDALNAGTVGKILEVADEESGKRVQIFVE